MLIWNRPASVIYKNSFIKIILHFHQPRAPALSTARHSHKLKSQELHSHAHLPNLTPHRPHRWRGCPGAWTKKIFKRWNLDPQWPHCTGPRIWHAPFYKHIIIQIQEIRMCLICPCLFKWKDYLICGSCYHHTHKEIHTISKTPHTWVFSWLTVHRWRRALKRTKADGFHNIDTDVAHITKSVLDVLQKVWCLYLVGKSQSIAHLSIQRKNHKRS